MIDGGGAGGETLELSTFLVEPGDHLAIMNIKGNTFFVTGGGSGLGAATRGGSSHGGQSLIADVQEASWPGFGP